MAVASHHMGVFWNQTGGSGCHGRGVKSPRKELVLHFSDHATRKPRGFPFRGREEERESERQVERRGSERECGLRLGLVKGWGVSEYHSFIKGATASVGLFF